MGILGPRVLFDVFDNLQKPRTSFEPDRVDWQYVDGTIPLHKASKQGKTETARLLIELNANVDTVDEKGNTSLILAARQNRMDSVRALVQAFAGTTIRGEKNMTAGEWAKASWGCRAIAEYLATVNPSAQDKTKVKKRSSRGVGQAAGQRVRSTSDPAAQAAGAFRAGRRVSDSETRSTLKNRVCEKAESKVKRYVVEATREAVLRWDTKRVRQLVESMGPSDVWKQYGQATKTESCDGATLISFESFDMAVEFGFFEEDARVVSAAVSKLIRTVLE